MNPLAFFLLVLKASLFSTGGLGNVPSLHNDLLLRGWASERQFAESLAVGQVSPGPNGLWVVALGYLLDGVRGALLALLAICLPPVLVIAVDRLYQQIKDHPAVSGFMHGLSLAVVGVFVVVMYNLLSGNGIEFRSLAILAGSMLLGVNKRIPIIAIIAIAAFVGILWQR